MQHINKVCSLRSIYDKPLTIVPGPAYGTPSTIGDSNSPQGVPGPYIPPNMSQRHNVQPQPAPQQHHAFDGTPQQQQQQQQQQFGSIANTMMYPFDGAMDADPFGLSASMRYVTNNFRAFEIRSFLTPH